MALTASEAQAPLSRGGEQFASIRDWGVRGNNDPQDGERIQQALNEAPLGGNLFFPPGDYKTRQPLRATRQLNLIGAGARLVGEFSPRSTAPLLEINVEDPVNRDNRNQRIQGLRLIVGSGVGDGLAVRNRAPNVANIGLIIENNLISGPSDGAGCAIRLEGIGTHHLAIRNNQIVNGVYLASADGVTIEECLIFGEKTGVTVDLAPGAMQTHILRNGIVARDGALRVLNGSQVYFEQNQIEQFAGYGLNRSSEAAHVSIVPQRYGSRHIRIKSNNFGGGDYARLAVYVKGDCQDLLIDDNVFNLSSTGTDIELADEKVSWTRVGPNNTVRQNGVARRLQANAGMLQVQDNGLGTFGVTQSEGNTPASPQQPGPNLRFWKTLDNVIRFEGRWGNSGTMPGTRLGTLPVGFRPRAVTRLLLPTTGGELAIIEVKPDGALTLMRTGPGEVDWSGASFVVAPRPNYPISDP